MAPPCSVSWGATIPVVAWDSATLFRLVGYFYMYFGIVYTCCDTHRSPIYIERFSPCQNWDFPTPGSLNGRPS
jgi:hypothetical protein